MNSGRDGKIMRFVMTSLIAHGLLTAVILNQNFNNQNDIMPLPIDVSFQQKTPQKNPSTKTKTKTASTLLNNSKLRKSFILGHSLKPNFNDLGEIERRIKTRSARWDVKESYLTDDIGYSDLDQAQVNFSATAWTEINDAIVDSPLLAEYGQTGNVYLQFVISEAGALIEDSIQVKADNKVLQVFALRSVRKAFKKENLDLKAPQKRTQIAAHFRWTPGDSCQNLQGANFNYLSFCRVSSVNRRTFSGSEKASVYLSSLMYGPGAMEEIKKYQNEENRRNTGFDPFQEIKRDPDWNLGG